MKKIEQKLFTFDLDGTIVDSCFDVFRTLNIINDNMMPPITYEEVRSEIAYGITHMIKLFFPSKNFLSLKKKFFFYYKKEFLKNISLFFNIKEVLLKIKNSGHIIAIISNKKESLVLQTIKKLKIQDLFSAVIGGDTLLFNKPDPRVFLHAIKKTNFSGKKDKIIHIGDSPKDIEFSNAFNVNSVLALYGYIPPYISYNKWKINYFIHHPEEILKII